MTGVRFDRSPGHPLRTAAISGLAFTVLYLLHRLLQGTGPNSATAAAVLALDQLQGRTPIVWTIWTITALVAVLSLAIRRTGLVWRWLGVAGFVAAAVFVLGSVFSVLRRTPDGPDPTAQISVS